MWNPLSYRRPINMIVIVNIITFTLLYLYSGSFDWYILLVGLLVILAICLTYFFIIKKGLGDEYLFLIAAMLVSLGVVMICRLGQWWGIKQIVWFASGITLFFLSYYIYLKFNIWDKLIYYFFGISIALFLVTLVFGENINGATSWIIIKGLSFQPSELTKILFILTLAAFYKHPKLRHLDKLNIYNKNSSIVNKFILMLIGYSYMGFLVLQRDWGTALLLFLVYFTLLYVFDNGIKMLVLNAVMAAAGAVGGFVFLYHIKVRVFMWLNPWTDIAGKGYQITQSLFAIGSGGFFGTGIGMGRPDLIPEVRTDFIFSAICEEMGVFGGVAVILLYFILTYRGLKVALTVKDIFNKTVALGITLLFGFQTFIIIGGVIKLIPLTGITLPFISYGGSSMTTSFIALGILQAVSKKSYDGEEGVDERE